MPQANAIAALVQRFFPDGAHYIVPAGADAAPVIAARMSRSTRSFSLGQRVLVYDGYWGMNERVKIVAHYRRKHRWARGVCPRAALVDCRAQVVYEPAALRLLEGAWIPAGMFRGAFGPSPD